MAETVELVAGDNLITLAVQLALDGVAPDLTAATIEAHLTNRATGDVTVIDGVTGDAEGVAYLVLTATELVAGSFFLEHEVTTGAQVVTYPSKRSARILLTVRPEAD